MKIEIVPRSALSPLRYREAVELCQRAYDEDDDIADIMRQFGDATHVLMADAYGRLISHALWIERWLICESTPIRSAYVELVATDPDRQGQGFASAVLRALGTAIADFDIGALSPSDPAFYARFGWETWRGPLFQQDVDGRARPSPPDEVVMVLSTAYGPKLNLDGCLTAPWRMGDIW